MSRFKIHRTEEKKRAKKRNRLTVVVMLLLLSPFILISMWLWFQIHAIGKPGEMVKVEIAQGSGVSTIGSTLESKGVVRSGSAFALYSRLNRRGPYYAGLYELNKNIDASKAATILEKGPIIRYDKFTIIPGQRLSDVEKSVAQLPRMSAARFDEILASHQFKSKFSPEGNFNLEGLLLPETYSISPSEKEEDLIRRPLQEFDARATTNGLTDSHNGYSAYQIITIASLIEKEARYSADRPLIASVIYNRLAKDMPLQIDATVIYGLGRSSGAPSLAELQKDTPYNTYMHKGLVPTPISMVSMDSLRAALNPAQTSYLYYVLSDKNTGQHSFANTYEEHLANIEKAKQAGAL